MKDILDNLRFFSKEEQRLGKKFFVEQKVQITNINQTIVKGKVYLDKVYDPQFYFSNQGMLLSMSCSCSSYGNCEHEAALLYQLSLSQYQGLLSFNKGRYNLKEDDASFLSLLRISDSKAKDFILTRFNDPKISKGDKTILLGSILASLVANNKEDHLNSFLNDLLGKCLKDESSSTSFFTTIFSFPYSDEFFLEHFSSYLLFHSSFSMDYQEAAVAFALRNPALPFSPCNIPSLASQSLKLLPSFAALLFERLENDAFSPSNIGFSLFLDNDPEILFKYLSLERISFNDELVYVAFEKVIKEKRNSGITLFLEKFKAKPSIFSFYWLKEHLNEGEDWAISEALNLLRQACSNEEYDVLTGIIPYSPLSAYRFSLLDNLAYLSQHQDFLPSFKESITVMVKNSFQGKVVHLPMVVGLLLDLNLVEEVIALSNHYDFVSLIGWPYYLDLAKKFKEKGMLERIGFLSYRRSYDPR